jgi:hypothetical protein
MVASPLAVANLLWMCGVRSRSPMSLATSMGPALAVFCHLHGTTWVASHGTTGVSCAGLVEACR